MSDQRIPPPNNEPIRPSDLERTTSNSGGHWYNFPGQPTLQQPRVEPMPERENRHNGRQSARDRVRRRKVRRELGAPDDWAWVVIAAALLGMTVIMSMAVFFLLQATRGASGRTNATSVPMEPTSVIYGPGGILEGEAGTGGMLGNGESMIIHPWDGEEPFTILFMGMDMRPGDLGASARTDTMILIRIDPMTDRVGMLSIPRDLYVDVPGYALQRINTAYSLGTFEGEAGGPLLAMQTVQYNLGIRINEYVMVDFNTFIKIVDLIGGVDVEVKETIYDPEYPDMNYGYDPFYLEAGWRHLDGATALKYARSRHSAAEGDIDRARRQQQVIFAIRDKVLAKDYIPTLAAQAPQLWSEMSDGIKTGLSLDQILELAWYLKDIPFSNFTQGVLDYNYVESAMVNGMSILIPSRNKMPALMTQVFGENYNQ